MVVTAEALISWIVEAVNGYTETIHETVHHDTEPEHSMTSNMVSNDQPIVGSESPVESGVSTAPNYDIQEVLVEQVIRGVLRILAKIVSFQLDMDQSLLKSPHQKGNTLECHTSPNTHSPQLSCPFKEASSFIPQNGPFVRLITKTNSSTLVHFGQLVGLLNDRSGFWLQRVASFDPKRVQPNILAKLRISDICALTETRRHGCQSEMSNNQSVPHLVQQIIKAAELNTDKRGTGSSDDKVFSSDNGLVTTTQGLVLIRASHVREMKIISDDESEADSSNTFNDVLSAFGAVPFNGSSMNSTSSIYDLRGNLMNAEATLGNENSCRTAVFPRASQDKTVTRTVNSSAPTAQTKHRQGKRNSSQSVEALMNQMKMCNIAQRAQRAPFAWPTDTSSPISIPTNRLYTDYPFSTLDVALPSEPDYSHLN